MRSVANRFRPRPQRDNGIAGAYWWAMNPSQQKARVRTLLERGLTIPQISSMTHESCSTIERLVSDRRPPVTGRMVRPGFFHGEARSCTDAFPMLAWLAPRGRT